MQTHTAERMFMTAWCCFVLLMLISVNKATAGTACSITQKHAPHYTSWCPGGIELCILSLSRQPHHMEIWEEQGVCQGACTEYNQAGPYWKPSPALSFPHTLILMRAMRMCRWSLKCEMILLSCCLCGIYFPIKLPWQVCLMGLWCWCVLGCAFSFCLHLLLGKKGWSGARSNEH